MQKIIFKVTAYALVIVFLFPAPLLAEVMNASVEGVNQDNVGVQDDAPEQEQESPNDSEETDDTSEDVSDNTDNPVKEDGDVIEEDAPEQDEEDGGSEEVDENEEDIAPEQGDKSNNNEDSDEDAEEADDSEDLTNEEELDEDDQDASEEGGDSEEVREDEEDSTGENNGDASEQGDESNNNEDLDEDADDSEDVANEENLVEDDQDNNLKKDFENIEEEKNIEEELSEVPELEIFPYAKGEIIVKYKDGKKSKDAASLINQDKGKAELSANRAVKSKVFKKDQRSIKVVKDNDLDQIEVYKIPDLAEKIEKIENDIEKKTGRLNINKSLEKEKKSKDNDRKVNVHTEAFGNIEINVSDISENIDPYTEELLEKLNNDPEIEYAELNRQFSISVSSQLSDLINDKYYSDMWPLENIGQTYPVSGSEIQSGLSDADIDFESSYYNIVNKAGEGVVVAVVDTGIDYTHPDFGACTINEINDNNPDTCSKFVAGFNFVEYSNDPKDGNGHGTHCAGTIGALKNDIGIIGIAPKVKLMPLRALNDDGAGYTSSLANAVIWATDHGADIINASWGGPGDSQSLRDAFQYAYDNGVVSIVAAGNDYGSDALNYSPAMFDTVITVGASDSSDELAYFSNIGPKIDVVAPGYDILSTKATSSVLAKNNPGKVFDDDYLILSGTSMATPHVVGVAAAIKSSYPSLNNEQIRQVLRSGADDKGAVAYDDFFGYGRLNMAGSFSQGINIPVPKIISPKHYAEVNNKIIIEASVVGNANSINSWNIYLRSIGNEIATTSNNGCSGDSATSSAICEINIDNVKDFDYYIVLEVTNYVGEVFYDHKKVSINNLEITSIRNNDIYRLGDILEVKGSSNKFNYNLYWSKSALNDWQETGMNYDNASLADNILGHWDTEVLSGLGKGYYDLKIVSGENEDRVNGIYFNPELRTGWPVHVPYDYENSPFTFETAIDSYVIFDKQSEQAKILKNKEEIKAYFESDENKMYYHTGLLAPVVADVAGDSDKEIIVKKYGTTPQINIYKQDGELLSSTVLENIGSGISEIVIGDINNDGENEIVVQTSDSDAFDLEYSALHALKGDGTEVSGYPIAVPKDSHPSLAIADLDHNGINEIIIQGNNSLNRKMVILSQGIIVSEWNLSEDTMGGSILSTPAVGNFDADPDLEIVVAGPSENSGYNSDTGEFLNEGRIDIFNMNGSELADWPVYVDGYILSSPVVGDIDNDGANNIIVGTMYSSNTFPEPELGGLYAFDNKGNIMPGWPFEKGYNFWSIPSLADVDNNGDLEIVASRLGFITYLINYKAEVQTGWPQSTSWNDYHSSIISDINEDNKLDILTTAGTEVYAWSINGNTLDNFPKVTEYDAQAAAVVADIDNNGELELIASSNWDAEVSSGLSKFRGSIYVWDLNTAKGTEEAWPAYMHDAQNTGNNNINAFVDLSRLPKNLTANGKNPSDISTNPVFTIDWDNSSSSYPYVWYKLGQEPNSDEDGLRTNTKPFQVTSTKENGQMLYVWLEDNDGNKNFNYRSSVRLNYVSESSQSVITPENLTANGKNPSDVSTNPTFLVDFDNPNAKNRLVSMEGSSNIYYLGQDNKRYVFPNYGTYESWYNNDNNIDELPQAELEQYQLGGIVYARPGSLLMTDNSASVYAVEPNGVLRSIKDEKQARDTFGDNWQKRIVTVPSQVFSNYTIGSELFPTEKPAGSLLLSNGKVYYFDGRAISLITNENAFRMNNLNFEDTISVDKLAAEEIGENINGAVSYLWDPSQKNNFSSDTIVAYRYKLGEEPKSNTDGVFATDRSIWISASQEGGQMLYVWLENASGYIDYTKNASVQLNYEKPKPEIKIEAPIYFHAEPRDGKALLSWRLVVSNEFEVAGYNIYKSLDSENFSSNPINTALISADSYEVSNLENWKTYYFKIETVAKSGKTSKSDAIFVTPYEGPFMQLGETQKILTSSEKNIRYYEASLSNNRIAWFDYRGGYPNVYMFDLDTKTEKIITSDKYSEKDPRIQGDSIVWSGSKNGNDDIYMYDLKSNKEQQLSSNLSSQFLPKVYGDNVIWYDNSANRTELVLYNTESKQEKQLTSNSYYLDGHEINNDRVIWMDMSIQTRKNSLYMYDIETQKKTTVFANLSGNFVPDFDKQKLAWSFESNVNEQSDIYMHDLDKSLTKKVTYSLSSQYQPKVSNNKIAWKDIRNKGNDIYLYDSATNNEYWVANIKDNVYYYDIDSGRVIWTDFDGSFGSIYSREVYTIPGKPKSLETKLTGDKPNENVVTWTESFDSSGIKGVWYKIGEAPKSNEDGIFVQTNEFKVVTTGPNIAIYVWQENNDGRKDHISYLSRILKNDLDPGNNNTGGGSSGGGGGSSLPPAKASEPKADIKEDVVKNSQEDIKNSGSETGNKYEEIKDLSKQPSDIVEVVSRNEAKLVNIQNQFVPLNDSEVQMYVSLVSGYTGNLDQSTKYSIAYFIHYGTVTTKSLGTGERAGVLGSYLSAYGRLPSTDSDWQDVIKIANGRWPNERNEEKEKQANDLFKQIYKRDAKRQNPSDDAAVMIMAYGLRPADRNMNSEKTAIEIYERIFGFKPESAQDWDQVRAIAYSGAVR